MSFRERLLVRRLRERDERAFRELVERYGDRVYNVSYRMLGDREEAQDLAQEVFITVFKSIDSFRGDAKFSTWLYRIATNHCKNRLKYLARRHHRDQSSYDDDANRPKGDSAGLTSSAMLQPDQQLAGAELELAFQRCIASLEEDQRILIVLRDVEELSYDEIAAITNLAEGTVKSRLHRARMALRNKMRKLL